MILDVGCGSGFFQDSKEIKNRGFINIDILKPKNKIRNFVLCDCHNLPFKDNIFEKVLFIDVIEHIENPTKTLKELKRVSNNKIIIGTPNSIYFKKILRCYIKGNYKVYFDHVSTYGLPELRNLCSRVKLNIVFEKVSNYRVKEKNIFKILSLFFPYTMKKRQILIECKK